MSSHPKNKITTRATRLILNFAIVLLLILGWLYVSDFWKTPEEREQKRRQGFQAQQEEFKAVDEAEQKCREEGALDMDDCVGYQMREYHRGKKLIERAKAEIKQYKQNK